MSFWSAPGTEPKRNYRWIVLFGSGYGDLSNISYSLKKVNKPKLKIAPITHSYLNHKFNYPGRVEWEEVQMTFASTTTPDATQIINNITLYAGYGVPSIQQSGPQAATLGKNKFAGAMGNTIEIHQLDANGSPIEKWYLHNPFFTSIAYGDGLDYSNEEITEIVCGVKYDWAQLETFVPTDNATSGPRPG
jgi:hypothetical protein